jgi:manganese/iron transport system substrate-binding protein
MLRPRRAGAALLSIPTLVLVLVTVWTAACDTASHEGTQSTASSGVPHTALAAETFLADIARNVAGDKMAVESLMPVGADPHGFEPTPSDAVRVAECSVLIVNGAGFEPSLEEMLRTVGERALLIEASAGLASRTAREGEEATISDSDLAEAMCSAVQGGDAVPVAAGADISQAAALPTESGLFAVKLCRQADGTYAGYLRYETDEPGDFQFAFGPGELTVLSAVDGIAPSIEKDLPLECAGVSRGQIMELEQASYVLTLAGFESEQVGLLVGPAGGNHHHDQGDPHFWLDPTLVVRYVENIRDGLSRADPSNALTYETNAAAYIESLAELDAWINERVAEIPPAERLLVTNHESLGYFADRYGFRVVGTVMPTVSADVSPSAQQLARLVATIQETRARAIFLETGSNPQLAEQVAAETGIEVVTELYSHSLTDADGPAPTYLDMMRANTEIIAQALR